jgi:hypothetical protein
VHDITDELVPAKFAKLMPTLRPQAPAGAVAA